MTFTFTLLSILIILIGALAIFDGVSRIRGRRVNSILAILEIILGALILLYVFFNVVLLSPTILAIALEVVVIVLIVTRGTGRGRGTSASAPSSPCSTWCGSCTCWASS